MTEERWLIVYWEIDAITRKGRWVLAPESFPHDLANTARIACARYRRELGSTTVRLLHTADG